MLRGAAFGRRDVRINFLACLIGLLVVLSGCVLAPPVESPPSIPSPIPSPSPSPPTSRSVHLLLGNPSNAVADVAKPDNYLMVKPQYALSYNRSKGTPNWVSWQLNSRWLGEAERQNNFRPDPQLPTGWYRVTPRDYTNSGFDRGHLTSSEDRGVTVEANSATFLMTNIIPQAPDNNQGPWVALEEYCRDLVRQGKELYIIAGGRGQGGAGKEGEIATLAAGKIVVPASTWKVIVVLDKPGAGLKGITTKTRVIAVDMPNRQGIKRNSWQSFKTSVDQIEAKTQYDFLSSVPRSVQAVIEANVDSQ
jgi:endonuclease G